MEQLCLPEFEPWVDERNKDLLASFKARLPQLKALLAKVESHWRMEDMFYRFYHHSFKVFYMQNDTAEIVKLLREFAGKRGLSKAFLDIVENGAKQKFSWETTNKNWAAETQPILEAFFHAHYFLKLICQYAEQLEYAPCQLPSGWAVVLYLYNTR